MKLTPSFALKGISCHLGMLLALMAHPAIAQNQAPSAAPRPPIGWGNVGAPTLPANNAAAPASPWQSASPLTDRAASRLPGAASPTSAFERARAEHAKRQLDYAIHDGSAMAIPLANLQSLVGHWQSRASAVNTQAQQALERERGEMARLGPQAPLVHGVARDLPRLDRSPTAASFDWRAAGIVTPVDAAGQGNCGSCWAFAAAAALEASHRMRNGKSSSLDISEQELLDCTVASCNGGNSGIVFERALLDGFVAASDYPGYMAVKAPNCQRRDSVGVHVFHAAAWGYVDQRNPLPSVDQLKRALVEHGPLAVALYAGNLFQAYGPDFGSGSSDVFKYGLMVGEVFVEPAGDENGKVQDAYFALDSAGRLHATFEAGKATRPDALMRTPLAVNHAVTLIGWDDRRGAWLVKNSWGRVWGTRAGGAEAGYAWVKYGEGNIGAYAMWVHAGVDGWQSPRERATQPGALTGTAPAQPQARPGVGTQVLTSPAVVTAPAGAASAALLPRATQRLDRGLGLGR
ncbi:C1 family peptidase [Ideonella sp. DXS29W]|uniref:C1 family peptidase n=1 Tax=Ideonella lacteola TaxID=2984193 RepID=A0ABU9BYG2_9BURK